MSKYQFLKRVKVSGELSGIFGGMITLLLGSGLARLVGLISIPVLTRIYNPEDYGVLALYTSTVIIIAPLLSLRYVQAIPLPKSDVAAFHLFLSGLILILINSLFLILIVFFFGDWLVNFFSVDALLPWKWYLVVGASFSALYELFTLWATRKRRYKIIAKSQFYQSLTGNLVKISLGLLGFKPSGLLIGQIFSQSASMSSYLKDMLKSFTLYRKRIKVGSCFFLLYYYRDFLKFRLPSQILMVLSLQAPIIMMAALYTKELTGQLGLAVMALSLPIGLIGQAIAKAFYAEIAVINRKEILRIKDITLAVQKKLLLVGLPITVFTMLFVKDIFIICFGDNWAVAGEYASILAPFMLFQFTSSPLMEVVNIIGSQIVFLILHAIRLLGLLTIFISIQYFNGTDIDFIITISSYLSLFYLFTSAMVIFMLIRKTKSGL